MRTHATCVSIRQDIMFGACCVYAHILLDLLLRIQHEHFFRGNKTKMVCPFVRFGGVFGAAQYYMKSRGWFNLTNDYAAAAVTCIYCYTLLCGTNDICMYIFVILLWCWLSARAPKNHVPVSHTRIRRVYTLHMAAIW